MRVSDAARFEDATHLAKHRARVREMLEDVERIDEIEGRLREAHVGRVHLKRFGFAQMRDARNFSDETRKVTSWEWMNELLASGVLGDKLPGAVFGILHLCRGHLFAQCL